MSLVMVWGSRSYTFNDISIVFFSVKEIVRRVTRPSARTHVYDFSGIPKDEKRSKPRGRVQPVFGITPSN